jgi:Concanavalin A-like lectin/glucanases superfamily
MTALLKPFAKLSAPGQVKPTGVPRIDWSHPLAQGLVFYGFDTGQGLIIDLVRGRAMQSVSASGGPTPALSADQWSTGFLYDANHTNYFASDAEIRNLTAAPPWTCACAFNQQTIGVSSIPFCRTANNGVGQPFVNWCFQNDALSDNHLTFAVNSGGTFAYIGTAGSGGAAVPPNAFHTLLGVANSSSSATYFVDGVSQGTTTGLSIQSVDTNDAICFGGDSSASVVHPCPSAFVPYGAFWNRALSASEILQLHLDPYCFLLSAEGEMPALYLAGTTVALSGRSLGMAIGRASPAGGAALSGARAAAIATGSASASGKTALSANLRVATAGRAAIAAISNLVALSGHGIAVAVSRAALRGAASLSGRGAASARGQAPVASAALLKARAPGVGAARAATTSVAALSGRAVTSARGAATASGRVALWARTAAVATGRASLSAVAALVALAGRSGAAAAARAAIAGTAALAGRAAAGATTRLAIFLGNLIPNPRVTVVMPGRRFASQLGLPMPQGPDFSVMDVGETLTGAIDFAKWLPSGVTIASIISVTATNHYPGGGSSYATVYGLARIGTAPVAAGGSGIANAAVLQQWQGVAPGVARIEATITTSDGQTLIGWSHQPVSQPC